MGNPGTPLVIAPTTPRPCPVLYPRVPSLSLSLSSLDSPGSRDHHFRPHPRKSQFISYSITVHERASASPLLPGSNNRPSADHRRLSGTFDFFFSPFTVLHTGQPRENKRKVDPVKTKTQHTFDGPVYTQIGRKRGTETMQGSHRGKRQKNNSSQKDQLLCFARSRSYWP